MTTNTVTIAIDATKPRARISSDFVGLSISSMSIDGGHGYVKCFTPGNTQMVNLFRQIGIKHLRTIMGAAAPRYADPSAAQIDSFFDFAAAAGVEKIIWSLHLFNAGKTNWSDNKAAAEHIWKTTTARGTVERHLLESFAFDNEPDWRRYICCKDPDITGYLTPTETGGYIGTWERWRKAVAAVAPGAEFSGPDGGSKWPCAGEINTSVNNVPFTRRFALDEGKAILMATQHFYGQTGISNFTTLEMAKACLSGDWLATNYEVINKHIVGDLPVPFRFTECSAFNNEHHRGNQCFATALWALDFCHWWAARGCDGVDPFTRTAQFNSPVFYDGSNYIAEPCAYGLKAFALGSHGRVIGPPQLVIGNPAKLNLTAYAVVDLADLYVTVVNKTFNGAACSAAQVVIAPPRGFIFRSARSLALSAGPGGFGDATTNRASLGGAILPNDGSSWAGVWADVPLSHGGVTVTILPTTAVVLDLQR